MDFKSAFKDTPAAAGFSLLDEGEYDAEISEAKLDMSKTPARLSIVYDIINHERFEGRKVFGNYNLAGEGIGYLKKDLDTLGLSYADVGSEEDIAELFWDNLPMQVVIFVNQKEWQGKTYNNVYLNDVIPDSAAHVAAQTTRTAPAAAAPAESKPAATAKAAPTTRGGRAKKDKDGIPF